MKTKNPMKATRRGGKKKSGKAVRTSKVQFCMTPEDADWLNEFAIDAGFVSRSQLITAIIERLMLCGFSGAGAARLSLQIQDKLKRNLKKTGRKRPERLDWDSLLLRPLPPLPEAAPFDSDLVEEAIEELNQPTKGKP